MSRLIWLIFVIALIAAFYFGWLGVKTSSDKVTDKSKIELSVDKGKVKEDTQEAFSKAEDLGRKIKAETQAVVGKAGAATESKHTQLTLDSKSIELAEGTQRDVTVSRTGGDHKSLQLGLSPSSGSNLLASGGLFKNGETSTRITVAAPKDARSGSIAIAAEGQAETLAVNLKP